MKPYPKYKDSGIEWIGEVPEGWAILPIRALCHLGRGRVISNEEIAQNSGKYPVYSSQTANNGEMGRINSYDFDGEYVTWTTDGANAGTVFYRYGKFNCTNVCGTLKSKNKFCMPLLPYILNLGTKYYVRYDINPKLMNNMMAKIKISIPPYLEQTDIVAYLDHKTTQIDNLISKKQKLIELLREERAAIINQAVTKGLNPDAPMKNSGIEWLGEVPEHWEVKRLKWLAKIRLSNIDKKSKEGELEVELCKYVDVYHNGDITSDIKFMKATARQDQIDILSLAEGDVLITKDSESPDDIAVPAFVPFSLPGVVCGYHLAHARPYQKYSNGKYLFWSFSTHGISNQFEISANGVTRFGIGKQAIDNSVFLNPPLVEQAAIAAYLDHKTTQIDQTISKIEKQIDLLKEYRTALIYEVVTGKIDVRT